MKEKIKHNIQHRLTYVLRLLSNKNYDPCIHGFLGPVFNAFIFKKVKTY